MSYPTQSMLDARPDITNYLFHWTRSLAVLKHIISCGFLKPTHAERGNGVTIRGPYPAVCYTDQPLHALRASFRVDKGRYRPYGVALHKWAVYEYGGRPVIYGDYRVLGTLLQPGEVGYEKGKKVCKGGLGRCSQYLWVRFEPIPEWDGKVPSDWSHEREWRTLVTKHNYEKLGKSPEDGVPLLLPWPARAASKVDRPRLFILVNKVDEAANLKEWIKGLLPYQGSNGWLKCYFEELRQIPIIALQHATEKLEKGDSRWERLDTVPVDELSS